MSPCPLLVSTRRAHSTSHVVMPLAVPKDLYVFPDFPYPEELLPKDEYPTGQQVGGRASRRGPEGGRLSGGRLECQTCMDMAGAVPQQCPCIDGCCPAAAEPSIISSTIARRSRPM